MKSLNQQNVLSSTFAIAKALAKRINAWRNLTLATNFGAKMMNYGPNPNPNQKIGYIYIIYSPSKSNRNSG